MSSRKQRRRREKAQRHEWEFVAVDEEGNESPVEPVKSKTAVATQKPKTKTPSARTAPRDRGAR